MFIYNLWPPVLVFPQASDEGEEYSEALKHMKDIRLESLADEDELGVEYE